MQGSTMKKRSLIAMAAVGCILIGRVAPIVASEPLDLFDSETAARQHCGKDAVVWLDVPTKTFRSKGQKGYDRTKSGGYTCRKDAVGTGNHAGAAARARRG